MNEYLFVVDYVFEWAMAFLVLTMTVLAARMIIRDNEKIMGLVYLAIAAAIMTWVL